MMYDDWLRVVFGVYEVGKSSEGGDDFLGLIYLWEATDHVEFFEERCVINDITGIAMSQITCGGRSPQRLFWSTLAWHSRM